MPHQKHTRANQTPQASKQQKQHKGRNKDPQENNILSLMLSCVP